MLLVNWWVSCMCMYVIVNNTFLKIAFSYHLLQVFTNTIDFSVLVSSDNLAKLWHVVLFS